MYVSVTMLMPRIHIRYLLKKYYISLNVFNWGKKTQINPHTIFIKKYISLNVQLGKKNSN